MESELDFDPSLPTLPLVLNLDGVAQLFQEQWPQHNRHPISVTVRRLQDVKYQPETRCVATYELIVEEPGATPWQTIGVVEISPSGVVHRLFNTDPQLPWLVAASDPVELRVRFMALQNHLGGATVDECRVTPIRYKPGSRCVLRYELQTSAEKYVLFGKLLAQGGGRLMAMLGTLYRASQASPAMPRILYPLDYWPELHLLILPAVQGAELNIAAFDITKPAGEREQLFADVGQRLAALHASAGAEGPRHKISDELRELQEYVPALAQVRPVLAMHFGQALETLARAAALQDEPLAVASHGAFRTDQLLIENGQLVMIDMDSFCWANPARDIGNFLAYLHWKAVRQPQHAAFIERASQAFLDGYAMLRRLPAQHWLAVYRAVALLKIAGRRFRNLTSSEWPLTPHLIDEALAVLA